MGSSQRHLRRRWRCWNGSDLVWHLLILPLLAIPMHVATSPAFKENAHRAIQDAGLQKALARSGPSFVARRTAAVTALPEFEQLRDIARDIKNHTLAHLDFY